MKKLNRRTERLCDPDSLVDGGMAPRVRVLDRYQYFSDGCHVVFLGMGPVEHIVGATGRSRDS